MDNLPFVKIKREIVFKERNALVVRKHDKVCLLGKVALLLEASLKQR